MEFATGQLRLGRLDECSFRSSQPMTVTWVRHGARKRAPYENLQRRWLNVLAATVQWADQRRLRWLPARRHCDAVDLVGCLELQAIPSERTVVVIDNARFHRDRSARGAGVVGRAGRLLLLPAGLQPRAQSSVRGRLGWATQLS